jgi:dynein intermediate chain 2, axonemal
MNHHMQSIEHSKAGELVIADTDAVLPDRNRDLEGPLVGESGAQQSAEMAFNATEGGVTAETRNDEMPSALPRRTRRVADAAVTAIPQYAAHVINTTPTPTTTSGMCHAEGGWPREVDPTDGEAIARWRKKVERDERYIATIIRLGGIAEEIVRQNNALDIYQDFFGDIPAPSFEPPGLATNAATQPLNPGSSRGVQALCWLWGHPGSVSVVFSGLDNTNEGTCCIFDVTNPLSPVSALAAPNALLAVAHNSRHHNLLVAGQADGHLALFDTREAQYPVSCSGRGENHRDKVTGVAWVQSKTGTEMMSAGSDGAVIWWDSRQMKQRMEQTTLLVRDAGDTCSPPLAASCLDYNAAGGPAKFMVGTAQGHVLAGNRRAKSQCDRITASFRGHHNAVNSVCRNPLFLKYFLSSGDWTARLWAEDIPKPLVTTPYHASHIAAAAWNPLRPAVFYTAGGDGVVEAWDVLQSHSMPVLSTRITDGALTALNVRESSGLLALGGSDGCVRFVQPTGTLVEWQEEERAALGAMLEREGARERSLEKIAKEAKVKARREGALAAEAIITITDAEIEALEREFAAAVHQEDRT